MPKFQLPLSFALAILVLLQYGCGPKNEYGSSPKDPSAVVKNLMSFLTYRDKNIQLYKEFTGLDPSFNKIDKKTFMKLLATGSYLPLKLSSTDSHIYYQLTQLNDSVNKDIKTTIKDWGKQEYDYYLLEGKEFPDFQFIDMDGNKYNNESIRGKIVVFKCWFLACLPCVKEIPTLNELRQKYKDRKDILFISLCWDSKSKVATFLKKNKFLYSTVPDQYKFLTETLMLNGYPTHFILTKEGKIFKKTQDNREMEYALNKLSSK